VVVDALRAVVAGLDIDVPVHQVRAMADLSTDAVAGPRLSLMVVAGFAGAALLLSVLGVYGVMAQDVGSRRREIGVRIALGADTRSVVGLIVGQAGRLVVIGVPAGLAIAWGAGRHAASQVSGLAPAGVWLVVGVAALVGAVSLLAAWLPARRAARVDPALALRAE
jgi:ABC-type antimicrobial peptide transport system permease subunit